MTYETAEQVVGIAWYDRAQWALLKQVAADRAELDESYEAWEMQALEAERMVAAADQKVVRVPVNVTELATWCLQERLPNTRSSRAQYVAQAMQRGNSAGA